MNFIYKNSNKSGIGDRLMDLILVYTYSKYLNCNNLFLHWHEENELIGNADSIYSRLRIEKTPARKIDYLLKNLLHYLLLPDDIVFVNNKELNLLSKNEDAFVFNEYLGMQYPLDCFINKYEIKDIDKFEKNYFNNFNKIGFKNISSEIQDIFKSNDIISIHLRRGDKVVNDGGTTNNIEFKELKNLDTETENYIMNLMDKNVKICIVSDEKIIRNNYLKKFQNILFFDDDSVGQTYIDLFCLANSSEILLSQNFSSFSLFASLINSAKFNYILDGNKINTFSKYKNIQKI
jgi:hypothetical protein